MKNPNLHHSLLLSQSLLYFSLSLDLGFLQHPQEAIQCKRINNPYEGNQVGLEYYIPIGMPKFDFLYIQTHQS